MDGELEVAHVIVSVEILDVRGIIDIIQIDPELLALLEVVLNVERLDPARVEVVHDDLSHADTLPLVAHLLGKDDHAIGSCECIHVGQVDAGEAERHSLDKATLISVDRLIDSSQDCLIEVAANAAATLDGSLILMRAHARHAIAECGSHINVCLFL